MQVVLNFGGGGEEYSSRRQGIYKDPKEGKNFGLFLFFVFFFLPRHGREAVNSWSSVNLGGACRDQITWGLLEL